MMAAAARLTAQVACTPPEKLMSWPAEDPVWEFCWLRPLRSSGTNGSGLEIRNVHYNGHLVLKRGHVPILNVQYATGGGSCGGANRCYRDWLDLEQSYISDNVCPPPESGNCGYAEPGCPPVTVCEHAGGLDVCDDPPPPPDPPPPACPERVCFTGVSAEKLADRLIMTSQSKAGWYRYTMKWTFHLDGRIEPFFGFAAVNDNCVNFAHRHHAYWRLDFDVDGPAGDIVTEGPDPTAVPPKRGRRPPIIVLPAETMRFSRDPGLTWSLVDAETRRGYRIVPGAETELPADSFSVGDVWLLNYRSTEIDDAGQSGPACAIKVGNFLTGESLSGDVVVWYRTGAFHDSGHLDECHAVGPTLVPLGDWSP